MNTQKELVQYLVANHVLSSSQIIAAFEYIDRRDFVFDYIDAYEIYDDHPLPISSGQTISQPSTVAFMMELLNPQTGENVLDVGTGSGWTTAILAQIVGTTGKVHGVEIVPELVQFGSKNLQKYDFAHASILQAKKMYGLPEFAPYDKILVSAASDSIPEELIEQLTFGGVMVIPIENKIVRYTKNLNQDATIEHFYGFSFVPLINPHQSKFKN